jgi:hypothetical protein
MRFKPDMSPRSLSGETYYSYERGDGRYPCDGWYPSGGRYADDRRLPDDGRYLDDRLRSRQQVRRPPRPTHDYVEYLSGNDDDEFQEARSPTRKSRVAPHEKITFEDKVKAGVEEMFMKRDADDKQWAADEKDAEEKRLKAQKDADEIHKADIEKALANQAAAYEKAALDKKLATEAELAAKQRWRMETDEAVKRAVAAKTEAGEKAAADRRRTLQLKAEADKAEAERFKVAVAQEAEKLFVAHMKQQADDLEVAGKAKADKIAADKMEKLYIATEMLMAAYESRKEKKVPLKKPASKKAAGEKNKSKKTAIPEETGIPDWLEDMMAPFTELLCTGPKDDNLGHGAALLEEGDQSGGEAEFESLSVEVSGSKRGSKGNVGKRKKAKTPKEEKRNRKPNRKAKGEEKQGERKDGRNKKNGANESRKPALNTMRWFASC